MKSPKARWIVLTLLCVLIFVGFVVGTRLTSDAILVEFVTKTPLFHPDDPKTADADGRHRLDPDDETLPSGPEPRGAGDVTVWLSDQWPGARLGPMRSLISGGTDPEYRLAEFEVARGDQTSPAILICVRRPGAVLFRGWVLIFDRQPEPGELFAAEKSYFPPIDLFERLRHRVGSKWLVEYEK